MSLRWQRPGVRALTGGGPAAAALCPAGVVRRAVHLHEHLPGLRQALRGEALPEDGPAGLPAPQADAQTGKGSEEIIREIQEIKEIKTKVRRREQNAGASPSAG